MVRPPLTGPWRRGATVLEFLVAFPVLVIALMAILELGWLAQSQSLVQSASESGADAALQIRLPESGNVPDSIVDAIRATLRSQHVEPRTILVEHNLGPTPPCLLIHGDDAQPPTTPVPAFPYVRVSVCVNNGDLAPNLLRDFCLDLSTSCSQRSTTRCY